MGRAHRKYVADASSSDEEGQLTGLFPSIDSATHESVQELKAKVSANEEEEREGERKEREKKEERRGEKRKEEK